MVGFLSQLITGVHHLVCRKHERLIVQALGGEKLPGSQFSLQILKPDCFGRRVRIPINGLSPNPVLMKNDQKMQGCAPQF